MENHHIHRLSTDMTTYTRYPFMLKTNGEDYFECMFKGIDHESWGETEAEALSNFVESMAHMENLNTHEAFLSLFTVEGAYEKWKAYLHAYILGNTSTEAPVAQSAPPG